ncbi:hypothetical protein QQS21_009288 [Conoideocrella luteorostrata]|uniref:Uncharacterized protein n=1 Tax=Conoideocrella luteorostrata TaxID=1105319 RepID=A0AAJ0CJI9_9HYPO|nr:hypothetical protein QQS21_009288 [Conoideocrella luteorostrata]
MDIPSSIGSTQSPLTIPPEKIYYRPLYSINGIDRRIDSWIDATEGNPEEVHLDLDLAGAKTASWASLGFLNLDNDSSYKTNAANSDVKLSLEAGGMQAFDIDRGFWDVSAAARSQLGFTTSIEPGSSRLMKITRILLGYRVKIKIRATDDMKNQLPDALLGISGDEKGILGMPTATCTLDHNDGQIVAASAPSGFPAVLAVLGREI